MTTATKVETIILDGRVALITGGGSGIGAAIARRFARDGARVAVMGRRSEPLVAVAAETDGLAVPGDVTRPDDVRRAIEATVERFGGLDIVINNAGVERSDWQVMFDVHVTGSRLVAEMAVPRMIERGGGAIVNVASVAALVTGVGMGAYSTSKAALLMLTRALAVEHGPRGIRVNAICPGWVRTPMSEREMDLLGSERGISREEAFRLATRHVPLRRPAEPDEIAAVCRFLASRDASFMTGAVLVVDGGSTVVDIAMLAFEGVDHDAGGG